MLKKFTLKRTKDIIYEEGVPEMCNPALPVCPEEFLPLVEKIKGRRGEMTRMEVVRLVEEIQRKRLPPINEPSTDK